MVSWKPRGLLQSALSLWMLQALALLLVGHDHMMGCSEEFMWGTEVCGGDPRSAPAESRCGGWVTHSVHPWPSE